jgi:hypothetical protein
LLVRCEENSSFYEDFALERFVDEDKFRAHRVD